ncbi:MAG: hypothetical protein R6W82_12120 [bacterium]
MEDHQSSGAGVLRLLSLLVLPLFIAAGCGGGDGTGPGEDPDLLYEESFDSLEDGPLPAGWEVITQQAATEDTPADWRILNRRLHQASNVHAPSPDPQQTPYAPDYEGTMAVVGDTSWVSVSIRVDLIPRDDDGIGVVFRYRDSSTDPDGEFYRLLMVDDAASGGPRLRMDKRVGGAWEIIDQMVEPDYGGYDENGRYVVEIDMVASSFTVEINGRIFFEFDDASIPRGQIGLFCYGMQGADFDNIRVYREGP